MFSVNNRNDQPNLLYSHLGVDLTDYKCHQLKPDPVYSNYSEKQLHYAINAMQKGQKPPTKIGLKRLKAKNAVRWLKEKHKQKKLSLNPKSPQINCLKALRIEFRNNLEKNHLQIETQIDDTKSYRIAKRKEHQRKRRNELIKLVKKYRDYLQPHFGDRLNGYGKCSMVSRQQIKNYLLTLGVEANIDQQVQILAQKPVLTHKNPYEILFDEEQKEQSQQFNN